MNNVTNLILAVGACGLLGACTFGILTLSWSFFEGTKLGQIFIEKLKGRKE